MDDNYISEEEYQQKLDEIRERDPNLYEYIMWGNDTTAPFNYDAFETRLLLALEEQKSEEKPVVVVTYHNKSAREIAEEILSHYIDLPDLGKSPTELLYEDAQKQAFTPMTKEKAQQVADAMLKKYAVQDEPRWPFSTVTYERKEIAPEKYINVRTSPPFTPAWFDVREYGAVGDGFIDDAEAIRKAIDGNKAEMSALDNSDVDVLAIGDVDHMDTRSEWTTIKIAAIGWKELEATREDRAFQQQMEQNRRDIAAIFGITLKELGVDSSDVSALQTVAEIQRHEITIESLVGYNEMEKHRYELRERAASCAAHCFHANGYAEYYDMVYRLCAEGYSLEQAIYGYKKQVGK